MHPFPKLQSTGLPDQKDQKDQKKPSDNPLEFFKENKDLIKSYTSVKNGQLYVCMSFFGKENLNAATKYITAIFSDYVTAILGKVALPVAQYRQLNEIYENNLPPIIKFAVKERLIELLAKTTCTRDPEKKEDHLNLTFSKKDPALEAEELALILSLKECSNRRFTVTSSAGGLKIVISCTELEKLGDKFFIVPHGWNNKGAIRPITTDEKKDAGTRSTKISKTLLDSLACNNNPSFARLVFLNEEKAEYARQLIKSCIIFN